MPIVIDIDVLLARKKMSVADFAEAIGISPANVAVLKNGRAKAVRFTTLDAICRVLECQPGDVLRWIADPGVDSTMAVNADADVDEANETNVAVS